MTFIIIIIVNTSDTTRIWRLLSCPIIHSVTTSSDDVRTTNKSIDVERCRCASKSWSTDSWLLIAGHWQTNTSTTQTYLLHGARKDAWQTAAIVMIKRTRGGQKVRSLTQLTTRYTPVIRCSKWFLFLLKLKQFMKRHKIFWWLRCYLHGWKTKNNNSSTMDSELWRNAGASAFQLHVSILKSDKIRCAYLVVNCVRLRSFWTPLVLAKNTHKNCLLHYYHVQMQHGDVFSCICLQCCNLWKPDFWYADLYILQISRSRSFIKVIGNRSMSHEQTRSLAVTKRLCNCCASQVLAKYNWEIIFFRHDRVYLQPPWVT